MLARQDVIRTVAIAFILFGAVNCNKSGGGGGGGTGVGSATLVVVYGDNDQAGLTGGVVQVRVELTGAADIQSQTINWSVTSGGGTVPATTQTSNTGIATVNWTLGSTIGLQGLKAEYNEPGSSGPLNVSIVAVGVTNPACVPGTYVSGAPQSANWTSAKGAIVLPNGVSTSNNGLLTIAAGTTVCLGPLQSIQLVNGGRLTAVGTPASSVTVTALDLTQPWGSLRFDHTPALPSTLSYAELDHGSLGAIGLSTGHVLQVDHSTITEMTGLGVRIIAPGSYVHSTTISKIASQGAAMGARLGSPLAPSAVLDFSARVTGTPGIQIEAAGATLSSCEVSNNTGGIWVLSGAGPVSISGCNLVNNAFGVSNVAGNASVDATGNWWGSPAGPGINYGPIDASGWLGGAVSLGY